MKRRVPLRQRLFVVVVAAVVPLAIMAAVAIWAGYQQQRSQAERAGLDVARAMHTAVVAELRRTISVLQVLASSRAMAPLDKTFLLERARQTLTAQTNWRAISLADPQGRIILDTRHEEAEPLLPAPDTESLQRVIASQVPVVGYLVKSNEGGYTLSVRVPVMRNGELRFVISAVLDPNAILTVLNSHRAAESWTVAAADAKGNRVARTRSVEQSLGTPFSPTLVAMMARGGSEGAGTTINSEGDSVFTAYTRGGEYGWTTAVGQSTALVEAAARDSFMTFGTGVALSTLLGALVALFMARRIVMPITQLREAAIGMGRGERFHAPELDVRELHDVSMTLAAADEGQARAHAEREELLKREQAARAAAEAANRAKDEFLAMLGHELRNPLGAISNAAYVLENEKLDGESARRTRAIIMRQVGHLTRLTDDLLDAARALMGKIVLRKRPLDLSAVAMQSIATLKGAHRLQGHRIIEDFQPAWVDADGVRLDQVIVNLVVNAVKYTPPGGTIRISVRREGHEAILTVADDGIGLAPELAPNVFDLFVQGDRALDRNEGGLGIGLTLVRRLAELHGGSAVVHSDGPGLGSEFIVRLPLTEPASALPDSPPRMESSGSRHILLVEDNADARDTLAMLLEIQGHRVETAADGPSGLEKALALQPEVALIDVGLPGMDGYEVARRIRASRGMRRPLLVALTGYGAPEDRERALAAGFDSHVVKPVDDRTLAEILSGVESKLPS